MNGKMCMYRVCDGEWHRGKVIGKIQRGILFKKTYYLVEVRKQHILYPYDEYTTTEEFKEKDVVFELQ